jgi:hypothetical protein
MARTLTTAAIKRNGACEGQLNKWKLMFGAGHKITEDFCVQLAEVFCWQWCIYNMLKDTARHGAMRELIASGVVHQREHLDAITQRKQAAEQFFATNRTMALPVSDIDAASRIRSIGRAEQSALEALDRMQRERVARIFARYFNAPLKAKTRK